MPETRREAALALSEELLTDIELSQMPAPELLKKVSRLARLLDDNDALEWLGYEMHGFPKPLTSPASNAAVRSGRDYVDKEGATRIRTNSISEIQAEIEMGATQISAAVDGNMSVSSANPNQFVMPPPGNTGERSQLRVHVVSQRTLMGKIMGGLHRYVSERQVELRFGAAVESAFTVVRNSVDSRIAQLAPSAAVKLAAALENASSDNPEHWANAASACRRLLKAIADELRPAGEPVSGRAMTDDKYINRLVDWIVNQGGIGSTLKDVVTADLEDFGKRIDAFDDAGHKGAHAEVSRYEASRFITGAYLLIGDILNLWAESDVEIPEPLAIHEDEEDDVAAAE